MKALQELVPNANQLHNITDSIWNRRRSPPPLRNGARQQLLNRLRRFEKLAALDPIELEQRLIEDSDDEYQRESVESENDEPLSLCRKHCVDTLSLEHNPRKMSTELNRLVSAPIVEKKSKNNLSPVH